VSLEEFVARHGPALLRLSYLLTGQHHAAEDLFQDCLVKLHRNWSRVTNSDAPLAYAKRTLVNEYLSGRRRRWTSELPVAQPLGSATEAATTGFDVGVVERDRMWRLLAGLPAKERATLVLCFYEDLSDQTASELLGCRPSTVRSNKARALARLRQSLQPSSPEVSS